MGKAAVIFSFGFAICFFGNAQQKQLPQHQIITLPDSIDIQIKDIIGVDYMNRSVKGYDNMNIYQPRNSDRMIIKIDSSKRNHLLIKEVPSKPFESDSLRSKEDY